MANPILNQLALVTATTAIAISLLPSASVQAGDDFQFICTLGYDKVTQKKFPTTYLWSQGKKRAIIRWTKTFGAMTPQERCNQVSPRLQEAYNNGSLNIITNGKMNNQPVICTTRAYEGACDTLLLTLRPTDNSIQALNELKDALSGRSMGPMRQAGGGTPQIFYQIDLNEAIRNAPVE